MRACFNKKYPSIVQVTVFVLCISSVCMAGLVEFTDEYTFKNETGSPQHFIDFESYGDGTPTPPGYKTPISGDEWLNLGIRFAYLKEPGADDSVFLSEKEDMPVSPTHVLQTLIDGDDCSSLITFLTPVVSFGLYIVDNETTSITEKIILYDEKGNVLGNFPMPDGLDHPPYPVSHDFRGYLSTIPIAWVHIIEDGDGEGMFLENVMYSVVPEPATLLLLGLGGLILRKRRR